MSLEKTLQKLLAALNQNSARSAVPYNMGPVSPNVAPPLLNNPCSPLLNNPCPPVHAKEPSYSWQRNRQGTMVKIDTCMHHTTCYTLGQDERCHMSAQNSVMLNCGCEFVKPDYTCSSFPQIPGLHDGSPGSYPGGIVTAPPFRTSP